MSSRTSNSGALVARIDIPCRMLIEFLAGQILDRERALGHQREFRRSERAEGVDGAARPANEADLEPALAK